MTARVATPLAAILIASPFLTWAGLSALSFFTMLEPPLTASRGVALAMQVAFSPTGIAAPLLGIGIVMRSAWARRIGLVAFALGTVASAWVIAVQATSGQLDSNLPVAIAWLVVCAGYFAYFSRPAVREAFDPAPARARAAEPEPIRYSEAMTVVAWSEVIVGGLVAAVVAYLWIVTSSQPLLDLRPGGQSSEVDELLRPIVFAVLALLLAPHALTTYASAAILFRRNAMQSSKRYAVLTCWTTACAVLVTTWLVTHESLEFDARVALYLYLVCGASLLCQAAFLYALKWFRPPP